MRVSPQYHMVYDPQFTTTVATEEAPPDNWVDLVMYSRHQCEMFFDLAETPEEAVPYQLHDEWLSEDERRHQREEEERKQRIREPRVQRAPAPTYNNPPESTVPSREPEPAAPEPVPTTLSDPSPTTKPSAAEHDNVPPSPHNNNR